MIWRFALLVWLTAFTSLCWADSKFEFDQKVYSTPLKKGEIPALCGVVKGEGKKSSEALMFKGTDRVWLRERKNAKTKESAAKFCASQKPVGAWRLPTPREISENTQWLSRGNYWIDGENIFNPKKPMNVYGLGFMDAGGSDKCPEKFCIAACTQTPQVGIDNDLKSLEDGSSVFLQSPKKVSHGKISVEIEIRIPSEGKQNQSVVWVGPLMERKVLKSFKWVAGGQTNWRLVGFTESGNSFWFYKEDGNDATELYSYDAAGEKAHIWKRPEFFSQIHRALEGGLHFFDKCGRRTGVLYSEDIGSKYKVGDTKVFKVR